MRLRELFQRQSGNKRQILLPIRSKMRTNRLQDDIDNGVGRFYRELSQLLADRMFRTLGAPICQELVEHTTAFHLL